MKLVSLRQGSLDYSESPSERGFQVALTSQCTHLGCDIDGCWSPGTEVGHLETAQKRVGEVWKDHLLQPYCNGHVQFAMLRNAIGYLRVTTFYDYTEGGYANRLHGLQQSLETMYGNRAYQALGSLL